jgi:predicted Fe-S protein YdhL (DUF1289 family)
MNITNAEAEAEERYVCAGICRVDPESSTCIGCGRPVAEPAPPVDAKISEQPDANSMDISS